MGIALTGKGKRKRSPKQGEYWEDMASYITRHTEVVILRVRADDVIVCRQHQQEDRHIEVTYDIDEFMQRFRFKCEAEPLTIDESGRHLSYREYLASEHWKAVRADALRRAENACQLCKLRRALQVHHNTYARLWRECPADVVVLCRTCHDTFSEKLSLYAGRDTRGRAEEASND